MKTIATFFLCSHLLFSPFLSAASSLFHVLIAEKWLNAFESYNEEETRAFMIGTLFPDIRYIANFPRSTTHEYHLSIDEIRATASPFLKGMRVHAFVDETRSKYLKKAPMDDAVKGYPGDKVLFLKVLEDEILSEEHRGNVAYITTYLQTVEQAELDFGLPLFLVRQWHKGQKKYLESRPSEFFRKIAATHTKFFRISEEELSSLAIFLPKYRTDETLRKHVALLFFEFDNIFSGIQSC